MVVLYLGLLGLLAFFIGVGILGLWLRKYPSKVNAEKSSRIMHFLFFAGLGAPLLVGFFYPGFTHLDELIGLNPLPMKPFFLITGIIFAIPGLYFLGISNKSLRAFRSGRSLYGLRDRFPAVGHFHAVSHLRARGAHLASQLCHPGWMARADDSIQIEGGPIDLGQHRFVRLSRPPGRRHPPLQGRRGARGGRSKAAR